MFGGIFWSGFYREKLWKWLVAVSRLNRKLKTNSFIQLQIAKSLKYSVGGVKWVWCGGTKHIPISKQEPKVLCDRNRTSSMQNWAQQWKYQSATARKHFFAMRLILQLKLESIPNRTEQNRTGGFTAELDEDWCKIRIRCENFLNGKTWRGLQ